MKLAEDILTKLAFFACVLYVMLNLLYSRKHMYVVHNKKGWNIIHCQEHQYVYKRGHNLVLDSGTVVSTDTDYVKKIW